MDDLFADPARRAKESQKRRAEEELSRPPSLIEDVVLSEPSRAKRRVPSWLLVIGAVLVTVLGSLFFFRQNQAQPPVWKEEPKPKLEMATPPPVPPLPGESKEPAVSKPAEPSGTSEQVPSAETPPRVQRQPVTQAKTTPAATPQPSQAAKAVSPSPAPSSAATPTDKPKLLREPEDLAKEQRAFDLLREKSQAARQLIDGGFDQFRFIQYEVIPKDAGLYWVDLIAEQKGAALAVHFIWAVNPDNQSVRALSQAARDIDH